MRQAKLFLLTFDCVKVFNGYAAVLNYEDENLSDSNDGLGSKLSRHFLTGDDWFPRFYLWLITGQTGSSGISLSGHSDQVLAFRFISGSRFSSYDSETFLNNPDLKNLI